MSSRGRSMGAEGAGQADEEGEPQVPREGRDLWMSSQVTEDSVERSCR